MEFFVVSVNNNKIRNYNNNLYSCPSCGEPAGNKFKGSGKDYESFICLKCGEKQSVANFYKCNIWNGIFYSQCPFSNNKFRNNNNLYSCPSCSEPAGNQFKDSGKDYESFICLKFREHQ